MKKAILVILLISFSTKALHAQTEIELPVKINIGERSILIDKKLRKELEEDKQYNLKVTGLNSAVISLKVTAKPFEISSAAPEILKTVLPGITTSLTGGPKGIAEPSRNLEDYRDNINKSLDRLNELKKASDNLYKSTIFNSDTEKAKSALQNIISLYRNNGENVNEENIEAYVKQDISYASTVKAITDELLKKEIVLEKYKYVSLIAEINRTNELIKSGNYPRYIEFLKKSTVAKNFVLSKPFYPEKDLVELKVSFVDTYAGDTISTVTRTLYTKKAGGIGLSFSSGFFYSEGLSDVPYYLKARQDENLAVLKDRRMFSDISVGALGHIYTNISTIVKTGPAIGLALSPFDGKSRYLLGWSVIFGKEKMLSISFGKAWAKQKQLSTAVMTDNQGDYLPKGTSAVPTYDRIVHSWFFGLTYNLATTRK